MIKKATFALAGVLGMVAAAALSTTAGAADTDAALANNVTFYQLPAFAGAQGSAEALGCKTVLLTPGGFTEARSAELLVDNLKVELFSDATCTSAVVATLDSTLPSQPNKRDNGLGWSATVKSFKLA